MPVLESLRIDCRLGIRVPDDEVGVASDGDGAFVNLASESSRTLGQPASEVLHWHSAIRGAGPDGRQA